MGCQNWQPPRFCGWSPQTACTAGVPFPKKRQLVYRQQFCTRIDGVNADGVKVLERGAGSP